MNESSQAITAVKREVQLSEWQRQIQERQEQGRTVDEWCISLGISKGTYYYRLRKVREYMCQRIGVMEVRASEETSRSAVVPIRVAQPKEKAAIEMQFGDLQIKFNESTDAEQLKVVLATLKEAREREKDVIVPVHKRKSKRTHEETFEDLPVEEVIHEVEDKSCPECGEQMETVGKEFVRDELVAAYRCGSRLRSSGRVCRRKRRHICSRLPWRFQSVLSVKG